MRHLLLDLHMLADDRDQTNPSVLAKEMIVALNVQRRTWLIVSNTAGGGSHFQDLFSQAIGGAMTSRLDGWHPDATGDAQRPAGVAVMIPTVVRPTILRALRPIYDQRFYGRIQIVIGIDVQQGDGAALLATIAERPAHILVLVVHLPWSTSSRHGGGHVTLDAAG